jgi:hypothetical protein
MRSRSLLLPFVFLATAHLCHDQIELSLNDQA